MPESERWSTLLKLLTQFRGPRPSRLIKENKYAIKRPDRPWKGLNLAKAMNTVVQSHAHGRVHAATAVRAESISSPVPVAVVMKGDDHMQFSDEQHRLLHAMEHDPKGYSSRYDLHAALFGKTLPRTERQIPPLTASQRASLSRSLRKLIHAGRLTRLGNGKYSLPSRNGGPGSG